MQKKILAWLLCAAMLAVMLPAPMASAADGDATTVVLTNEGSGYLIDQLIAEGHGGDTMYEVMQLLQPMSGGAIPASFMSALDAAPADSEVKTVTLNNFAGLNNPVGVNTNGTLMITSIYSSTYYGQEGYTTSAGDQVGIGITQFTAADSAAYYIDAGFAIDGGPDNYHVFAIAWAAEAPQPTTFVLSNEEGGLIDKLIAAGMGEASLYQTLVNIQGTSGGIITDEFLETLAGNPGDSEIFTVPLSNFVENYPVCINTDGTVTIAPIYARDYYGQTGYSTYPPDISGAGREVFTYADNPAYYIDAGDFVGGGGRYKAFAIAWSSYVTVAGTAADDTAILQIDNKTPSARDKTWEISVTSGTVKAGVAKADVTLSGLPAGLDYTAAKGTGNTIVITLTGEAEAALTADATVTAVIKGSAVTEADAQDSAGISLKLWYVGEATTIVLTNEAGGYLIDKLIAAGHENDNLYEVLELLQPDFSGVITERFMKTLASNPANSDIFDDEAALSNFAGLNNPICVNADGTLGIQPIFGRDLDGDEGYSTTGSNLDGVGTVWVTAADSPAYYVNAGEMESGGGPTRYYKAFAIAWMPELPAVTTDTVNTSGVTQNSTAVSGNVTSAGTASVTERGFVYGTTANPTTSDSKVTAALGTGTGAFSATLSGLTAASTYHVRAYATSDAGTAYGADRTFTTLSGGGPGPENNPPTVVTNTVTGISTTGATLNGNVTSDGGATVTARGFVYSATANPAIGGAGVTQAASGNGTGTFTANISGLTAGATYHVRAYATNSEGTSYGADVPFTTLTGGGGEPDDPYIFRTLTDSATGITVSGVIHRDAALTVKNTVLHAVGTCAACDAIRARMTDSDFITLIDRDISLSLGFTGSLTVTIPVGSAYNGETVTVLHCANGTLKTYTATVKDGKATFTVTSLSPFAVFADADELDNIPKTGDGGGFPLWLGLMASGVLLGSVLVLRRRPKCA